MLRQKEIYRQMVNRQGLQQIQQSPADPTARMGVGEDERWEALDMKQVWITNRYNVVIPDPDTAPYQMSVNTEQVTDYEEDAPEYHWLGDPIQGV